jgi:hypothetical protein
VTETLGHKYGERVAKDIRRATRWHFSAEDKIRIVLDDLRGEDCIAEICRKEARRLYMARDRLGDKYLPLTHETVAHILGTRRPGVTEAMYAHAQRGLICSERGIVTVVGTCSRQASPHFR